MQPSFPVFIAIKVMTNVHPVSPDRIADFCILTISYIMNLIYKVYYI